MARPRNAIPRHFVSDKTGAESWKVRFRKPDGTGSSETFYDAAAAEEFAKLYNALGATRALAYIDELAKGGDRHGPALTVNDLYGQWFEWKSAKKKDGTPQRVRSQRTLDDYERQYNRQIRDRFGSTPANLVSSTDVQKWVEALGAELEPKTILDYHGLLRSIYLWGLHPTRGLVIHDPCADTDLPTRRRKRPKGLRPDQWVILHSAALAVDKAAADLLLFMVSTSWRWSESVALTPAGVDHWLGDDGETFTYVTMGRVLRRVGSTFEIVEDDAKSDAGIRRVRIKGPAEEMMLRRIRGKALDEYVFTTGRGGRWIYSNFHDRVWTRPPKDGKSRDHCPKKTRILELAQAHGFTQVDVTPHWLRHTHVAMMILAGEPLHAISRRVGHSSTKVTSDVYGRMIEDISSEGLDKVSLMVAGGVALELPGVKPRTQGPAVESGPAPTAE